MVGRLPPPEAGRDRMKAREGPARPLHAEHALLAAAAGALLLLVVLPWPSCSGAA